MSPGSLNFFPIGQIYTPLSYASQMMAKVASQLFFKWKNARDFISYNT
jgi:hypothetical protein